MKTMRILIIIIYCSSFYNLTFAQRKVIGNYNDHFGNKIELKRDSTFFRKYWNSCWTIGKWTIKNDTIIFQVKPIFDTLRHFDENRKVKIDTLVLSQDVCSNGIDYGEYIIHQLASGGQQIIEMSEKMFYRNERLYDFDTNGKLVKKKLRGFLTNKKYVPWYAKE